MIFGDPRSARFKNPDKFEQRVCVKFCMKLGISATQVLEMLHQATGDHCLGRIQVFELYAVQEPAVTKTRRAQTECTPNAQ